MRSYTNNNNNLYCLSLNSIIYNGFNTLCLLNMILTVTINTCEEF